MVVLLIVSFLLVVLFVGTAIWKESVIPDSVSAIVYNLPKHKRFLWTLWMWAVSLTVGMPLMEAMPETWKFLSFLTLACLMFCGAMPLLNGERNTLHNVLGVAAGILSQVCVLIIEPSCILIWVLMGMYAVAVWNENGEKTWLSGKQVLVSEICCFLSLALAITEI